MNERVIWNITDRLANYLDYLDTVPFLSFEKRIKEKLSIYRIGSRIFGKNRVLSV